MLVAGLLTGQTGGCCGWLGGLLVARWARGLVAWAALTVLLIHIAAAVCRRPRRRGYEDHRDDFLPLMLSNQGDEK